VANLQRCLMMGDLYRGTRMASGNWNFTLWPALDLIETRFPAKADRVRQLFHADETFRGMCEDLAAAVEALKHADRQPNDVRELRVAEYSSLVEELMSEIGEALTNKLVVLKHPGRSSPKQH